MRHEKTVIYPKSIELMEKTRTAIEQFPSGFAFLAEQLRKSSSSVARNFAEGFYQDSKRGAAALLRLRHPVGPRNIG